MVLPYQFQWMRWFVELLDPQFGCWKSQKSVVSHQRSWPQTFGVGQSKRLRAHPVSGRITRSRHWHVMFFFTVRNWWWTVNYVWFIFPCFSVALWATPQFLWLELLMLLTRSTILKTSGTGYMSTVACEQGKNPLGRKKKPCSKTCNSTFKFGLNSCRFGPTRLMQTNKACALPWIVHYPLLPDSLAKHCHQPVSQGCSHIISNTITLQPVHNPWQIFIYIGWHPTKSAKQWSTISNGWSWCFQTF